MTEQSTNVCYELGLAHGASKPVVLMARTIKDVPSDLAHRRIVVYDGRTTQELQEQVASALKETLEDPDVATMLYEIPAITTLPQSYRIASYRLPPVCDPATALDEANKRLAGCWDVGGYCGTKGEYAARFYFQQFDQLRREGFRIRRMFRGKARRLFDLHHEVQIGILLHAEARNRYGSAVAIRLVEDENYWLEGGRGLTLIGDHLLVHDELREAHLTSRSPRHFEAVAVANARAAYDRVWGHGSTPIRDTHVEELKRLVSEKQARDSEVQDYIELVNLDFSTWQWL
ncbi:MAG: hypothetical protein AAF628_33465 [Planctomycetota bacterium]